MKQDFEKSIISIQNLNKDFGPINALNKINCKINEGEVLGLVGDNGAGKSTLVKILAGVYPPTSGSILYNGNSVKFKDPSHSRSLGIEIVYQDLGLVDIMNIGRNFFLGKEPTKTVFKLLDFKKIFGESLTSISKLGIHLNDPEQNVGKLSGGQKKSIAISRSLYFGVKVLMLDEPTAALSIKETETVLNVIKDLKKLGIAVVFITHNIHHAFDVCDRFIVLSSGEVILDENKSKLEINDIINSVVKGKNE